MPRLSDPLLIHAANLRSGKYAAEMTPQELSAFEDRLVQAVDRKLAFLDRVFLDIFERMKRLPEPDLDGFLKYTHILVKIFKQMNYLERFKFWHQQRRQFSDDFAMTLLCHEADSDSIQRPNRSSIKTQKNYSKFPPRQACMDLTDEQWQLIQHLLPKKEVNTVGRPPQSIREVLDAIFWKIRTGAPWDQIPFEYPSHQTCYRYYTAWMRDGRLEVVIKQLGKDLRARGGLNLRDAVQSGEIQASRVGRKAYIILPPHLQDTWRGSTALAILQFLYKELPPPQNPAIEKHPTKMVRLQEMIAARKTSP